MKRRKVVAGSLAAGAAAGVLGWLLGVVATDAALVGLLVAAVVAVPRLAGDPRQAEWPATPEERGAVGYYEVRRVTTMLRQRGDRRNWPSSKATARLRELAEGRLRRMGIDWSDDAARQLLGGDVYDLLDGDATPSGRLTLVTAAERVLDRLAEPVRPTEADTEGTT